MKKLNKKLVFFFIALMIISSALSFIPSAIYYNKGAIKEIKQNQQSIAISILELRQKTDLSVEEIVKIMSNFMQNIYIIEDIDFMEISNDDVNRIKNQEIVFLSNSQKHTATTIFMLDGFYIGIGLYPHDSIFNMVASRVVLTLLCYVGIGAVLIIVSANRVVRPIIRLSGATQEVAKGNFDIQIENNSKDEVGKLIDNFNKMTKELKSIEYLRKDFISSVSHEFKTPVASIQGFAKLLQNNDLTEEERQEYTQIIIEETSRMSKLSSNILNLSRLENQEMIGNKTVFSLDEQIRKSILLLEPEWSKKNIEFDIELDSVQFKGDEELLQQVWLNLLSNAIKFSYENGIITVRLYEIGSVVKVKISDTGVGMSEEVQERIFEKFYKEDSAHSFEGSGLGLSLVKRIVDLCGGKIYVKSSLGRGSTFTIELTMME
ncbi:sensor histidine kinase [Paratissierella segnis]|uniref:Heme sensor protein HssS n=1 Tax=Paratissierella segnis TaxID=2763679 RepID=A0A926ERJ6_9FIRM|nr:HAMP domain-containing sensor histidine kinase [Paratissierella segnis]MBC8587546.1 HAMP domain-containing histidine kinase [Paratissierella segnis]